MLKFSRLFKARPPDTTLPAEDRSGLEDTVNSSEMYLVDATCQLGRPLGEHFEPLDTHSLHW